MKICIPTEDDRGLESRVTAHFGSAEFLTMVDVDGDRVEVIQTPGGHEHPHSCHHVEQLKRHHVDAVVCTGLGKRAYAGLRQAGIDVLTTADAEVSAIVEAVRAGTTSKLPEDRTCGGGRGHRHGHGDGCH